MSVRMRSRFVTLAIREKTWQITLLHIARLRGGGWYKAVSVPLWTDPDPADLLSNCQITSL